MFRRWTGALLAALLLAGLLPAQDTPESMLQVARKQEARSVGKKGEDRDAELRKALDMFGVVPKRWPEAVHDVAAARYRMAEIHKRLGEANAALETVAGLLKMDAQVTVKAKALALEASIRRRQKDFDGAVRALRRITEEFTDEERLAADACLTLASIARQRKHWKSAITWAQRVLDERPALWRENVDAANVICNVLASCRQWPHATKRLDELDTLIEERFAASDKWPSVRKALDEMSARRLLTPSPVEDEE